MAKENSTVPKSPNQNQIRAILGPSSTYSVQHKTSTWWTWDPLLITPHS